MIVYVVVESESVDYHGTYETIVDIYSDKTKAEKRAELEYMKFQDDESRFGDVEFYVSGYELIT